MVRDMFKDTPKRGKSVLNLLEGVLTYQNPSLRSAFDKDIVIERLRKWDRSRLI